MFEKAKSILPAQTAPITGSDPEGAALSAATQFDDSAGQLRPVEWAELTARLSAARDLRRVLHRDANRQSGGFADAAAEYFRAKDNNEQGVNLVALEQSKGSSCIESQRQLGHAVQATRETE